MEINKILTLTALIFLLVSPMASAIYVGEARSLPTGTLVSVIDSSDECTSDCEEDEDHGPSAFDILRQEEIERERELYETKYSDWVCVNNQLQREVANQGNTELQFGGACGFEIPASQRGFSQGEVALFIIITALIISIILVVIALLAIALRK